MRIAKVSAVWCPWCLVMWPIWKEIEKEKPELETVYYDYDKDKKFIEKHNISDILPVAIFFDEEDNELDRIEWEVSKKEILEKIEKYNLY